MENVYQLKKPASIKKRKRVGRGPGSGTGKTSARGQKGQLSRAGSGHRAWFEGGQMPLQRRIPKRGFQNPTKKDFQTVNVSILNKMKVTEITPEILVESGYILKVDSLIKILGNGEISKVIKITADAFSKSAVEKITTAGGEVITRQPLRKKYKRAARI
jgi:large subunit ribosomal protein L15